MGSTRGKLAVHPALWGGAQWGKHVGVIQVSAVQAWQALRHACGGQPQRLLFCELLHAYAQLRVCSCCPCTCCVPLVLQIQAAVDSRFLEGLLSGQVQLPLTDRVDMADPVSSS